MYVVCCDLEGVFIPEIWINVAKKTGIEKLKLTTRDIKDYDELMQYRLRILDEHKLTLKDIQDVIDTLVPLEGAKEFLDWLRSKTQVIVVSDTFREFADPLMRQLGRPTLFCHHLTVDENGFITDYNLRQKDPKRQVVKSLHSLQYQVVAFGDSYNDVTMLEEADAGILYRSPDNVIADYPQYPVTRTFEELKAEISQYL